MTAEELYEVLYAAWDAIRGKQQQQRDSQGKPAGPETPLLAMALLAAAQKAKEISARKSGQQS